MKLVTYQYEGQSGAGWIDDDSIVVCTRGEDAMGAVLSLVRNPGSVDRWHHCATEKEVERLSLNDVQLMAPIPEPLRDIFCVGKNYHAHAKEFHASGFDSTGKEAVPSHPVVFSKATTSVVGPDAAVRSSLDSTGTVDYEGELAVVIGSHAFGVSKADAMKHVFGYTIVNDVTSRELQRRHNQWVIGKGVDTFCPMGPWLVTADEIGNVADLELETIINGQMRQKASVSDLIFDIPTLIETLSATMTLLPGDIIATGTPSGVGIGMDPPTYLVPGDRMTVRITGLGELHNPVV